VVNPELEWPKGFKVVLDTDSTVYKRLKQKLEKWVDQPELDTRGIVVVKGGKIVYEQYRNGSVEPIGIPLFP